MDYRSIEKAGREQGWRIRNVKKGVQFLPPDPTMGIVTWHGTPSDVHALRNFLSRLCQRGFIWPWPPRKGERP